MRRIAAAAAVLAAGAAIGSCGGTEESKASERPLPKPGPFFADKDTVRERLTRAGAGVVHLTPGPVPESVVPFPARAYRLETRGGTEAEVLVFRSANKALRARASAGPLTMLGDNVLVVIERRGSDIHRVRRAITSIGDQAESAGS